jgi:hypothetical protein
MHLNNISSFSQVTSALPALTDDSFEASSQGAQRNDKSLIFERFLLI